MSVVKRHPDTSDSLFSIQNFTLKFDDEVDIRPYLDELNELQDVEEVRFSGNTLGVGASEAAARALTTKALLKTVDLSDIFTGRLISEIPKALTALCTALLPLPALTYLDLSDNAFGGRSVEPMVQFISTHPGLEVLKLNNNGMGPAGGTVIAKALLANAMAAKDAGRKPSLRVLVCGRNRLENGSAPAFAKAFAALGTLEEVRMPQNGIRMEGISAIAKGLSANPGLRVLDLQDNTATLRGSRALASALPAWPKLETLNLSDCLLRPKGGYELIDTLGKGCAPDLVSLKLQSNELSSECIDRLAQAIEHHMPKLTDLELNGNYGNGPEDECYAAVAAALSKWGHEEALDDLSDLEEWDSDEQEDESSSEDEESDDRDDEDDVEDELLAAAANENEAVAKLDESSQDTKVDDQLADLMERTAL